MSGQCTVIMQCGIAMAALKKGKPHHLKRCGFTDGDEPDEIVCCPKTSIVIKSPEITTEEIATTQITDIRGNMQRKCEKCKRIIHF